MARRKLTPEQKERHRARAKAQQLRLRAAAHFVLGDQCVFCDAKRDGTHSDGKPVMLEAAHIFDTELRGMGRGGHKRYKDIIANPHAYACMCKRCHGVFDRLTRKLRDAVRKEEPEEPIPF